MATSPADTQAATPGISIPFPVASRPQRRYSNVQSVSLANAGSYQVVQLPATGWVRRLNLFFTVSATLTSGAGAWAADGPFNLINAVTVTDATGQPIYQPISGYNLYLVNKHLGIKQSEHTDYTSVDPRMSPEFSTSANTTAAAATFRLSIDFEIDSTTGYGCIPNLDSNASLQVKIDYAAFSTSGVSGATAATMSVRMEQEYWAPVGSTMGGVPVSPAPPGAGDFREIRYETQTVSPSSENLVSLTNRGGFIQGVILVSRAAGVRTALTAGSNVGIILDNQPINEGIPLESHNNQVRRSLGYVGTDVTNTGTPLSAGINDGLDTGVIVLPFWALSGKRDSWLNTRAGSLFQVKLTPGASASTLEVVTGLMQVKDPASFFA